MKAAAVCTFILQLQLVLIAGMPLMKTQVFPQICLTTADCEAINHVCARLYDHGFGHCVAKQATELTTMNDHKNDNTYLAVHNNKTLETVDLKKVEETKKAEGVKKIKRIKSRDHRIALSIRSKDKLKKANLRSKRGDEGTKLVSEDVRRLQDVSDMQKDNFMHVESSLIQRAEERSKLPDDEQREGAKEVAEGSPARKEGGDDSKGSDEETKEATDKKDVRKALVKNLRKRESPEKDKKRSLDLDLDLASILDDMVLVNGKYVKLVKPGEENTTGNISESNSNPTNQTDVQATPQPPESNAQTSPNPSKKEEKLTSAEDDEMSQLPLVTEEDIEEAPANVDSVSDGGKALADSDDGLEEVLANDDNDVRKKLADSDNGVGNAVANNDNGVGTAVTNDVNGVGNAVANNDNDMGNAVANNGVGKAVANDNNGVEKAVANDNSDNAGDDTWIPYSSYFQGPTNSLSVDQMKDMLDDVKKNVSDGPNHESNEVGGYPVVKKHTAEDEHEINKRHEENLNKVIELSPAYDYEESESADGDVDQLEMPNEHNTEYEHEINKRHEGNVNKVIELSPAYDDEESESADGDVDHLEMPNEHNEQPAENLSHFFIKEIEATTEGAPVEANTEASVWGECSVTCGLGTRQRLGQCPEGDSSCKEKEVKPCMMPICSRAKK